MKFTWGKIFKTLLIATICIVLFGPILLSIDSIKNIILAWLQPLKGYGDAYFQLIGALIGVILTISGALWQAEKMVIEDKIKSSNDVVLLVISELEWNERVCDGMIRYFETNQLKSVQFDREDKTEFWIKTDDTHVKVQCGEGKGIINNVFEVDAINKYSLIMCDMNIKKSLLNLRNGLKMSNSTGVQNVDTLKEVHKDIKSNIVLLKPLVKM